MSPPIYNPNKSALPRQVFNSTSHAKPQGPCYMMAVPGYQMEYPMHANGISQGQIGPLNNQSSIISSLNNDSYSGFFSGTSLSQSEVDESILLTKEEVKKLKKQKVGCSSSSCSICFENYSRGQVVRNLPCGHKFHYKCMKPWLRTSSFCPLCRFDLKTYCKTQVELEKSSERNSQGPLSTVPEMSEDSKPLVDKQPHSRTFIEEESLASPHLLGTSVLEQNPSVFDGNNQVKDEKELRRRVIGFETESKASFLGMNEDQKNINFGIEDHISEIGI